MMVQDISAQCHCECVRPFSNQNLFFFVALSITIERLLLWLCICVLHFICRLLRGNERKKIINDQLNRRCVMKIRNKFKTKNSSSIVDSTVIKSSCLRKKVLITLFQTYHFFTIHRTDTNFKLIRATTHIYRICKSDVYSFAHPKANDVNCEEFWKETEQYERLKCMWLSMSIRFLFLPFFNSEV